jgi:hypothetical protein
MFPIPCFAQPAIDMIAPLQTKAAWSTASNSAGLIQLGKTRSHRNSTICVDYYKESISTAGNNCSSATAKFGGGGSGDVPTVIYNLNS